MAKIIYRDGVSFSEWKQLDYDPNLTLQAMRDRIIDPLGDGGFVGHMVSRMFGGGNVSVEVENAEVQSFDGDILVIAVEWTYFHSRERRQTTLIRVMEGEL